MKSGEYKMFVMFVKKEINTKNHQDQTITNGKYTKLNYAGSKTGVLMYTVTINAAQ
jgi:hypothetical protein